MKKIFQPKSFVLQWHITERCNWRCKHCYQENYAAPELDIEKMKDILSQYVSLVKKWKLPKESARIHITGGEPFLREDFFSFLEEIKKNSEYFRWSILSNGSLLTENTVKNLKALGIHSFQVSLEGTENTNDEIRGTGSFQKVLAAIQFLTAENIITSVSFTLTRHNFREIRKLACLLAPYGVKWLNVRRIVPIGSGKNKLQDPALEPKELRSVYREIEKINKELKEKKSALRAMGGCENAVFNDEISSPDLMSYGTCGINDGRILTLMPDGAVTICRRFPIKLGNIREKDLEELYYSPIYENFRGENSDVPLECYACPNVKSCLGGAKCVTYALTGKSVPDVQCWKLFENLDESTRYIRRQKIIKKLSLFLKIFRTYHS